MTTKTTLPELEDSSNITPSPLPNGRKKRKVVSFAPDPPTASITHGKRQRKPEVEPSQRSMRSTSRKKGSKSQSQGPEDPDKSLKDLEPEEGLQALNKSPVLEENVSDEDSVCSSISSITSTGGDSPSLPPRDVHSRGTRRKRGRPARGLRTRNTPRRAAATNANGNNTRKKKVLDPENELDEDKFEDGDDVTPVIVGQGTARGL